MLCYAALHLGHGRAIGLQLPLQTLYISSQPPISCLIHRQRVHQRAQCHALLKLSLHCL